MPELGLKGTGSRPVGVGLRGFKSHPPHHKGYVSFGGVVYYRVSDVENLVKPPQYVDLNPTEYFILKIVASGVSRPGIFMRPIYS